MTRLPLLFALIAFIGLTMTGLIAAPTLTLRMDACHGAVNSNPFQVKQQEGDGVEFVEGFVRQLQNLSISAVVSPWGDCANQLAGHVSEGMAVAWAALEHHGISSHGDSLLGQATALVHAVRETQGMTDGRIGAGGAPQALARVPDNATAGTATWTVLRNVQ